MEIEGKPLDQAIRDINDLIRVGNESIPQHERDLAMMKERGDRFELYNIKSECIRKIQFQLGEYQLKKKYLELLQLTEEKRRLLTCIIEQMTKAVAVSGLRGNIFFQIAELHKRVNLAATMEELAQISEELIEFKHDYSELEK